MMQNEGSGQVQNAGDVFDLKTVVTNLGKIATSNINPFEIINALGDLDSKAISVAKSFGVGREQVVGITKAFVNARDEVFALGGSFKDILDTQLAATKSLGRNVTLSVEGQKELFAATKVTGQEVGNIVSGLKDVGISAYDAGDTMFKVVKSANEVGVSASKVSEMVLKNTSYLNSFNFKDGVEGLSKMAAQAVSLRIDMTETMKVADKAFNPEGAIKMAAELQRLGVTQSELLDPLNLMNLAENDPAELQNQIAEMSKQFVHLNEKGQFEILPGAKRQMRAIETSLGMASGTLAKMALSSAEVEEKMKRIKFPDFVSEDQKKTLANLSEMKDGKMMIEVNGESMELDKAIAEAGNQKGIEELLQATKEKSIEELAESQLSVLGQINSGINLLTGVVPAGLAGTTQGQRLVGGLGSTVKDASKGVLKTLGGTKGVGKTSGNVLGTIEAQLKSIDFSKMIDGIGNLNIGSTTLKDSFNILTDSVTKAKNAFSEFFTKGSNNTLTSEDVKNLISKIGEIFNIKDAIISPKLGTFKTLEEDDLYVGTGLSEMIDKLTLLKNTANVEPTDIVSKLPTINVEPIKTGEEKISNSEMKFDLNINISAPPQIDTLEVKKLLNDPLVLQPLMLKMEQVASNFSLGKRKESK